MATTKIQYIATGRRKRAIANIRISKGKGMVRINNTERILSPIEIEPLVLLGLDTKYDVEVKVSGSGPMAQQQAISLGIAKALVVSDPSLKPSLRKAGLITRDPREKERKKPGLKGARRAPQWQKR